MAIMRIRDEDGVVHAIRALKGEKGDSGGVRVGSYVGTAGSGESSSQYINLGSPYVGAVLLTCDDGNVFLVTKDGIKNQNGENKAILMYIPPMHESNMFLSVYTWSGDSGVQFNNKGVTYRYIAFVEEAEE